MNITKRYVENLAVKLFERWEITDWSFAWNQRKKSWGVCKQRVKRIELSHWIFRNTHGEDLHKFIDTLKHEIAHAKAGCHNGHNHHWKAWARKIGARPEATEAFKPIDPNKGVKWLLVDTSNNNKVVRRYYRKPTAKRMATIGNCWLPSRPQSMGCLKFIKA
jgi:predicted SprT family Zn-dependent metalloprotease